MPRQSKDQSAEYNGHPLYTAKMRFQDAEGLKDGDGPKFYEVGEDVSHFEQSRLDRGVALGTIQYNEPEQTAVRTATEQQA
jgi:hypothetical protein